MLFGAISQAYLTDIDMLARRGRGCSIHRLAENQPRDAYVYLAGLFAKQFIDTRESDWGIGSPKEDGEMAYRGLERYLEENRAPDPDIEEIDVLISVWKRGDLFDRLRGKKYVSEEALKFQVAPQDLAAC
jgi:hypothetical protein